VEEFDFSYVFARLMRFYGMSRQEVLDTPVKTFWLLNAKIDQLRAEEDMRLMRVMQAANSQSREAIEGLWRDLKKEVGTPFKEKDELDREGLEELRKLQFV